MLSVKGIPRGQKQLAKKSITICKWSSREKQVGITGDYRLDTHLIGQERGGGRRSLPVRVRQKKEGAGR